MKSAYQNQINNALCIDLSTLSRYNEICAIFKKHDIREYVYCFSYKGIIVKYGYSVSGSLYGERVYRQAGHLDGWTAQLQGSSGSDMRLISNLFLKKYGYSLNRNGMIVHVIDMNRCRIAHSSPYTPTHVYCKELERELIEDCIKYHGKAPIGNCDVVSKWSVRQYKANEQFKKLFTFED